jgi:acetyl-CoA carboxylase carboxyl transferase subunit alpha
MASLLGSKALGTRPGPQRSAAPARNEARSVRAQSSRNPSSPPDAPKDSKYGSREWLDTILSRFGPVKAKTQSPTVLDFEKPLLELDKRIKEVHCRPAAPGPPPGAVAQQRLARSRR